MRRNPSKGDEEEREMGWNPSTREGMLRIPLGAGTLEGFRLWTGSDSFPERGRIDFLAGGLEIDLSPENLHKHGAPKVALAAALYDLVVRSGKGTVLVDCTRIVSVDAQLSAEPDVLVVFWQSIENGRVRQVRAATGELDSFVEFEGAPDLVVEVISDSSQAKDRRRLPPLYAKAGIPELWLVDARDKGGKGMSFDIHHLGPDGYVLAPPDADGWCESRVLGRRCRLRRQKVGDLGFTYELELAAWPPALRRTRTTAVRRRAR